MSTKEVSLQWSCLLATSQSLQQAAPCFQGPGLEGETRKIIICNLVAVFDFFKNIRPFSLNNTTYHIAKRKNYNH